MKETTFEEQSSLKIYSLGIVVKAEDPVTGEIMVSPIESMNLQAPGIISQNKIEFRGSHPDDKGVSVDGNVKAENYVKAKWICIGTSNRVTSPTVYPNETVLLFRYSNNDVFYWTSIFHEADLRKKEAATFGFSNLSVAKGWDNNTPIAFNKETGYWIEIDAFKKLVSFTTPDNDGEPAKYTVEIDVAKSTFVISDNKSNIVKIDSRKGIEVSTDRRILIRGKAVVDIESSKLVNLTAPEVNVGGNLNVRGRVKANGLTISGSANITGDLTCGNIFCKSLTEGGAPKKSSSAAPQSTSDGGSGGDRGPGSGGVIGGGGSGGGGGSSQGGRLSDNPPSPWDNQWDTVTNENQGSTRTRNADGTQTTFYSNTSTNKYGEIIAQDGSVIMNVWELQRQYNSPESVAQRESFAQNNNGRTWEDVFGPPQFNTAAVRPTITNEDADRNSLSGVRPANALPATPSQTTTVYWDGPSHVDKTGALVQTNTGSVIQTANDRNRQYAEYFDSPAGAVFKANEEAKANASPAVTNMVNALKTS